MTELKPKFEEGYYSGLFSWEDLSSLINIRPLMTAERVYVYAPEDMKFTWTNDGWALDHNCYPPTLLRELMEKYVCYFCDMSRCTEKINAFAKEVEDTHFLSVAPGLVDTSMQEYLCNKVSVDDFPVTEKFIKSKKDGTTKNPKEIAQKIITFIKKFKWFESGSFIDLREVE